MIAEISIVSELMPTMGKDVNALNKLIAAHAAKQAKLQQAREKMSALPPAELDAATLRKIEALSAQRLELMTEEITLRRQIKPLLEACIARLNRSIINDAFQAVEQAKEAITAELLRLGFHPIATHTPDPGAMEPGWVLRHPTVRQAIGKLQELQARPGELQEVIRRNENAIKEIEAELARLQAAKLAAIG